MARPRNSIAPLTWTLALLALAACESASEGDGGSRSQDGGSSGGATSGAGGSNQGGGGVTSGAGGSNAGTGAAGTAGGQGSEAGGSPGQIAGATAEDPPLTPPGLAAVCTGEAKLVVSGESRVIASVTYAYGPEGQLQRLTLHFNGATSTKASLRLFSPLADELEHDRTIDLAALPADWRMEITTCPTCSGAPDFVTGADQFEGWIEFQYRTEAMPGIQPGLTMTACVSASHQGGESVQMFGSATF